MYAIHDTVEICLHRNSCYNDEKNNVYTVHNKKAKMRKVLQH